MDSTHVVAYAVFLYQPETRSEYPVGAGRPALTSPTLKLLPWDHFAEGTREGINGNKLQTQETERKNTDKRNGQQEVTAPLSHAWSFSGSCQGQKHYKTWSPL